MKLTKHFAIQALIYLMIFFSPLLLSFGQPTQNQQIVFTAFSYIVGAGIMIYFNSYLVELPKIEVKKINTPLVTIIKWGIYGTLIAFTTQIAASLIEQLYVPTSQSANTITITQMVRQSPFFLIAVTIAGPIMEEFIFRRGLIGLLSQWIAPLFAGIGSSLLFAVVHNDGHLLLYFSMGMAFYFLYQKTGSIWTSIIAHCSMNFLVMVIQLTST